VIAFVSPLEYCGQYKSGEICDRWLTNRSVYISSMSSVKPLSTYIEEMMGYSGQDDLLCRQSVEASLCRYVFPSCSVNNGVLKKAQLCADSCKDIDTCEQYLVKLIFAVTTQYKDISNQIQKLASHVRVDDLTVCGPAQVQLITRSLPTPGPEVSCQYFTQELDTSNSICELYNAGPVCESYLNGSDVFVDRKYNQTFLGNILKLQFNDDSLHGLSTSRNCDALTLHVLCHLLFPFCHESSKRNKSFAVLVPICQESCLLLSSDVCYSNFTDRMATFNEYFKSNQLNPVQLQIANPLCSRLPRKSTSADNCVAINFTSIISRNTPRFPTLNVSESTTAVAVVVPLVSVMAFLAIVIVSIICIWKRSLATRNLLHSEAQSGLEFKLVWDDDVAEDIPGCYIDMKRVELLEQIGEGNLATFV
jgi:hypothetical protein